MPLSHKDALRALSTHSRKIGKTRSEDRTRISLAAECSKLIQAAKRAGDHPAVNAVCERVAGVAELINFAHATASDASLPPVGDDTLGRVLSVVTVCATYVGHFVASATAPGFLSLDQAKREFNDVNTKLSKVTEEVSVSLDKSSTSSAQADLVKIVREHKLRANTWSEAVAPESVATQSYVASVEATRKSEGEEKAKEMVRSYMVQLEEISHGGDTMRITEELSRANDKWIRLEKRSLAGHKVAKRSAKCSLAQEAIDKAAVLLEAEHARLKKLEDNVAKYEAQNARFVKRCEDSNVPVTHPTPFTSKIQTAKEKLEAEPPVDKDIKDAHTKALNKLKTARQDLEDEWKAGGFVTEWGTLPENPNQFLAVVRHASAERDRKFAAADRVKIAAETKAREMMRRIARPDAPDAPDSSQMMQLVQAMKRVESKVSATREEQIELKQEMLRQYDETLERQRSSAAAAADAAIEDHDISLSLDLSDEEEELSGASAVAGAGTAAGAGEGAADDVSYPFGPTHDLV